MYYANIYLGHRVVCVHASVYYSDYYGYNAYCPRCGTRLDLVDYYSGPYFRHIKNSPVAQNECELYVSGYGSKYGWAGAGGSYQPPDIPFYIEEVGGSFQLYVGLPKITKIEQRELSDQVSSFSIEAASNYNSPYWRVIKKIESKEIESDIVNLIPLNEISQRYRIVNVPLGVRPPSWRSLGCSIPREGTLFHIYESSSKYRNVSDDGVIYIDKEYYLLISKGSLPFTIPSFINICGRYSILVSNANNWVIYKISITENSVNSRNFVKNYFHVTLKETPPEVIPLWPPAIKDESEKSSNREVKYSIQCNQKVYCSILNEKRNSHKLSVVNELSKKSNFFRMDTKSEEYDVVFHVSRENFICKHRPAEVSILWNKTSIHPDTDIKLKVIKGNNNTLEITANLKCSCSRTIFDELLSTIKLNENVKFHVFEPKKREIYEIYHGHDLVSKLFIIGKEVLNKNTEINDEDLSQIILKKSKMLIPVPKNIRYVNIPQETYPKSYAALRKAIHIGKISKYSVMIIQKYFNLMR